MGDALAASVPALRKSQLWVGGWVPQTRGEKGEEAKRFRGARIVVSCRARVARESRGAGHRTSASRSRGGLRQQIRAWASLGLPVRLSSPTLRQCVTDIYPGDLILLQEILS